MGIAQAIFRRVLGASILSSGGCALLFLLGFRVWFDLCLRFHFGTSSFSSRFPRLNFLPRTWCSLLSLECNGAKSLSFGLPCS